MDPTLNSINYIAGAYELSRLGRYDLALQEVGRALEQDPNSAEAHACGAWTLRQLGRLEEAEEAAMSALAADPNSASAYNVLACVLWSQGRLPEAENAFKDALGYPDLNQPLYLTNYALFLSSDNRSAEALAVAHQALALVPTLSATHEALGKALYGLGSNDEALEAYRQALRFDPLNAEAHGSLGKSELANGNVVAALDSFRESLHLRPGNLEAQSNLVLAMRALHPFYGWLLARTLVVKGPKVSAYFAWSSAVALALIFLVPLGLGAFYGFHKPMTQEMKSLWILLMFAVFTLYLMSIAWRLLVDPLFNTLLMFDTPNRRVLDYQPADAVGVALLVAGLLGFIAFIGSLLLFGPYHTSALMALCVCLANVISLIFLGGTRGTHGLRKRVAWGSYAVIVLSLYAMAVSQALWQAPAMAAASSVFVAGLAVYGIVWLSGWMEARQVPVRRQRTLVRWLVVESAFGVVGIIVGIAFRLNFMGVLLLGCAGLYVCMLLLAITGRSNVVRNFRLYRRWAILYGETTATRLVSLLWVGAAVFLIVMAFLFFQQAV